MGRKCCSFVQRCAVRIAAADNCTQGIPQPASALAGFRKKEKEAKKNQRVIEIKEIRLSLNIDVHDFETKVNHARKFLSSGNKVKVSIRFRGREMAHAQLGTGTMQRFADACAEFSNVEKLPKLEGRSMTMFLSPKAAK